MAEFQLPQWMALAPALALGLTALLLLVIDSINPDSKNRTLLAGVSTLGSLAAAGFAVWYLFAGTGEDPIVMYGDALVVDTMSLFFAFVFASVTTLVCVAS